MMWATTAPTLHLWHSVGVPVLGGEPGEEVGQVGALVLGQADRIRAAHDWFSPVWVATFCAGAASSATHPRPPYSWRRRRPRRRGARSGGARPRRWSARARPRGS